MLLGIIDNRSLHKMSRYPIFRNFDGRHVLCLGESR